MTRFAYQAVDATGRRLRGAEEADDVGALTRQLGERGLVLVHGAPDRAAGGGGARGLGFGRRREVLEVTRAVASLLAAGVPLARTLATADVVVTSRDVAAALVQVRGRVERGDALAAALAERPDLFPPVYVGVVRAGERSGDLAAAFAALATQLEREERLRARLLSASIYPLVLAAAGGVAVVVLLTFVLPRFAEMLADAAVPLPRSTAFLLALQAGVRRYWPALAALGVFAVGLAAAARTTEGGRRIAAAALLRVPVVGALRRHVLAARFARVTGVLLGGGAPLLAALDDARDSLADPLARDEVARIRARVREGSTLHEAVAAGALFPPLLARLLAVGEEAGQLEVFLQKAAEVVEERTERLLQRLVTLAEPAMILVFGGVVAFVALSLMQAIYGVNADALR